MPQRRLALLIWQAIGDPSSCAAVLRQRSSHVGNCEQVYVCLAMTAGRRTAADGRSVMQCTHAKLKQQTASSRTTRPQNEHAVLPDPLYGFLWGDWGVEERRERREAELDVSGRHAPPHQDFT